jgi:hypothetical protein
MYTYTKIKIEKKSKFHKNNLYEKYILMYKMLLELQVLLTKRGSFNFGKFQIFAYTIGIFFLVKFYIKIIFFSLIFVL